MSKRPEAFEFALPGGWVTLPLADEGLCTRRIERLVKKMQVDDGEGARLRREARDGLVSTVESARRSGATLMCLAGPEAAPVTGSLLVTPVSDRLMSLHETDVAAELDGDVGTFTIPAGTVTRAVLPVDRDKPVAEGGPTLGVDYWVAGPEQHQQVHLACSTPLYEFAEAMVSFFDAIVGSGTWTAAR